MGRVPASPRLLPPPGRPALPALADSRPQLLPLFQIIPKQRDPQQLHLLPEAALGAHVAGLSVCSPAAAGLLLGPPARPVSWRGCSAADGFLWPPVYRDKA